MCEAVEMIPSNENYQTQDTSVKVRDSEITVGFNLYPTTYLGHQNLTYCGQTSELAKDVTEDLWEVSVWKSYHKIHYTGTSS